MSKAVDITRTIIKLTEFEEFKIKGNFIFPNKVSGRKDKYDEISYKNYVLKLTRHIDDSLSHADYVDIELFKHLGLKIKKVIDE